MAGLYPKSCRHGDPHVSGKSLLGPLPVSLSDGLSTMPAIKQTSDPPRQPVHQAIPQHSQLSLHRLQIAPIQHPSLNSNWAEVSLLHEATRHLMWRSGRA